VVSFFVCPTSNIFNFLVNLNFLTATYFLKARYSLFVLKCCYIPISQSVISRLRWPCCLTYSGHLGHKCVAWLASSLTQRSLCMLAFLFTMQCCQLRHFVAWRFFIFTLIENETLIRCYCTVLFFTVIGINLILHFCYHYYYHFICGNKDAEV